MAERSREEATRLIAEVNHVLHFSSRYFHFLQIEKDRIVQWKLLCLILDSTAEQLVVTKFRDDPRILTLLKEFSGKNRLSFYTTRDWFKKLVAGFRNERGSLIDVVIDDGKKFKDRRYVLNKNFDESAIGYIETFKREFLPQGCLPEKVDASRARKLFWLIMHFIRTEHWDAWQRTLKELSAAAMIPRRKSWIKEVSGNSSNWVILLTSWKKFLGEQRPLIDSKSLEREVYEVVGSPEGPDVDVVVQRLCTTKKPILLKEGAGRHQKFPLNPDLQVIFETYTTHLENLRIKLHYNLLEALELPRTLAPVIWIDLRSATH